MYISSGACATTNSRPSQFCFLHARFHWRRPRRRRRSQLLFAPVHAIFHKYLQFSHLHEVTHRSIALAANILWRNSLPRYTKPELHIVNSSQLHSLAEIPKQWTTFYLNSPPAVPSSINVLDKAINSAALTIGFFVHLLRVRLLCTIKLAEAFFETPWLISESELRWSD